MATSPSSVSSDPKASPSPDKRKRVLIIGAGCSGMSSAYSFSLSPDKFLATVYDKSPSVGGSATSWTLNDPQRYGAEFINDGVQGASPVFHNTFGMFEHVLGYKAGEVGMQISFGKGKESFWSNVFPSELVDKFQDDIKKFGRVLNIIKRLEPIFAVIPVSRMLSMFRFSPSFGERMVYPLVALFFGTGNETKNISSAILERVFLDPSMRLFEFSEKSLLASVPKMMAFPELARVYGTWKDKVEANGNVRVETRREVTAVYRNTKEAKAKGGSILAKSRAVDSKGKPLEGGLADEREEIFDELILAADADSSLKILQAGSGATWKERKVLGNVLYKWDTTITHSDYAYMEKYYQMTYDESYNAAREDKESKEAFKFAKENWRPLYLIHMYEHDPSLIEMSFDLTHYQPQFQGAPPVGKGARIKVTEAPPSQRQGDGDLDPKTLSSTPHPAQDETTERPVEDHVYQTIFLDKERDEFWTDKDIAQDKRILQKWWKQQSHRWQLYAYTVPFMWTINGKNNTNFAGGWTLVNMHEVGICSGFAAAYSLGGKYPFVENKEAKRLMGLLYLLQHMGRMRKEDRDGFLS